MQHDKKAIPQPIPNNKYAVFLSISGFVLLSPDPIPNNSPPNIAAKHRPTDARNNIQTTNRQNRTPKHLIKHSRKSHIVLKIVVVIYVFSCITFNILFISIFLSLRVSVTHIDTDNTDKLTRFTQLT
jgi:hypothetical protein